MTRIVKCFISALVLPLLLNADASVSAQQHGSLRPRKLVPGVITTIRDVAIDDSTLDAPREFSELLSVLQPQAWKPNNNPESQTLLEMAKSVTFQREVRSLEIGFKSLRLIRVGGQDIWYFVYFVRNNGDIRTPTGETRSLELTTSAKPIRFVPTFVLQAQDVKKAYRDRIRPDAVQMIAAKERVDGQLHDSRMMSQRLIEPSTPTIDHKVWGVATWDNVDPRADFVSVFVQGLTNAYRWQPPAAGYDAGDQLSEQDRVQTKTLQLNFWRAGDEEQLNDREIEYGIPLYPNEPVRQQAILKLYQISKPTPYQWVFR